MCWKLNLKPEKQESLTIFKITTKIKTTLNKYY